MEHVRRIRKTDLARQTHQVIRAVQRGHTTLVENHGEEEAAILDIVDYRILKAVMRYYATRQEIVPEDGLRSSDLSRLAVQERYHRVLASLLAGAISLARAAEALEMSWLELRSHCERLDVPLPPAAPLAREELQDVQTAETLSTPSR